MKSFGQFKIVLDGSYLDSFFTAVIQDGHDHHHVPSEPGQFRADQHIPLSHFYERSAQRSFVQVFHS
jgi:hypothetical protein